MKVRITYFRNGQIHHSFGIVGFIKAVKFAARDLGKEMEALIAAEKDVQIETTYLGGTEWASKLLIGDEEVFGITVSKAL